MMDRAKHTLTGLVIGWSVSVFGLVIGSML